MEAVRCSAQLTNGLAYRLWISRRADQQPLQIELIIFSTFASSRSTAGLVPSSGPFCWLLLKPLVESAVPNEFVPGDPGRSPKAPPVTGMPVVAEEDGCRPMPPPCEPPPRANAAGPANAAQTTTPRTKRFFMSGSLENNITPGFVHRSDIKRNLV